MSDGRTGTPRIHAREADPGVDDSERAGISLLARREIPQQRPSRTGASDAILALIVSPDGAISGVLPGKGHAPAGLDGRIPDALGALWPADVCAQICEHVRRAIRTRHVQSADVAIGTSGGHLKLVFVPHQRDSALVVVLDTSAQTSAYSRVHELAYVDKATTLPTREYFLEELGKFTAALQLTEDRAAVICFSIEQSDARGNAFSGQVQDFILKTLASRLCMELRGANRREESDCERYSVAARIDYRQYGVLLPSITGGADAESVAMRLIESLQGPVKVGDREVRVTVRAGIAMFPQDGTAAEPLLESALSAMEDARNGHSSPYKFHSGTVKLRALQRKDLELELKGALDREGFSLDYLPIVDARTERIACVEALLRWPQALFGAQSIHKVVALAEYTGLIAPIGDWVMRRSIEQLRQWHEAGHADLRLSINLSGQQFARLDCVKRLAEILTTHAIDPGYVDVEITEYMLFRDAMKDYAVSKAFREHGFGVIVDDYGTGACSLAHFARSPVAGIKIDNGFVSSMTTHADERAACAAMTVMAHELKRKVIAEGVETAAQAEILKAQGCDFLQGFLFSKPMPARAATEFLAAGMREPRSGR